MFGYMGFFFRVAFWPLRRISDFLLPLGEYEGMSQIANEGASKQFTTYLKNTLLLNANTSNEIVQLFTTKSYADLQREATSTDALIMVFLHSPYHRSTNDICRQLLCSPSMVKFLTENKDRVKVMGSCTSTSQGASLSYSLLASSFPVLALLQPVSKSGSSSSNNNNNGDIAPGPVKLVFKAEGPCLTKLTAMQLTSLITATFQKHERTVLEAASRRYEQEQATALRRQQDEEYQETLRQDQDRERQRTEARLQSEKEEEEQREEEQRKITEEANRLDKARALLRDEPPKGTPGCARIRFRLPNGKQLDRRFEADETIGSLKAFLVLHFESESKTSSKKCEDGVVKRVALSTNFPKRCYGGEGNEDGDDEKTLEECDLCPQAVLMVQDLDA
jgi:FAS-associated factor 2